MNRQNEDFYQNLRCRIMEWSDSGNGSGGRWTEYLMIAPDLFHLLCKLSMDKALPVKQRVKLGAAVVYFVSPFDLLPEALTGLVGFADDIALAAYVLNSVVGTCNPDILRKHWAGNEDILALIRRILKWGDNLARSRLVGRGLMRKIRKVFK